MGNIFLSNEMHGDQKIQVLEVYFFDLVNLDNEGTEKVLLDVLDKISKSSDIDRDIDELLNTINWRYLVVASVAVLLCEKVSSKHINLLWESFDDGGNAVPQIASTLFIIDSSFTEKALERIDRLCEIKRSKYRKVKKIHPRSKYSGIGLVSLLSLLKQVPGKKEWANLKLDSKEVREIIEPNYLKYGDVCVRWVKRMKELLTAM